MYLWSFWGMNLLWWLFWIALLVVFFALATPVPRHRVRQYDHPLSILRRRYAAGEITTEEYEERRTRLMRDLQAPERPSEPAGLPRTQERHA
jgi:putative membrane protein